MSQPSSPDGLGQYLILLGRCLDRSIDLGEFERAYLALFKDDPAVRSERVFGVLDALFADVDAYSAVPGDETIDEEELRRRARVAYQRLLLYGPPSRQTDTCPVCGYPALTEPPRSDRTGAGSYEICPSRGFEFGVTDDDADFSYLVWRRRWLERGMPWDSAGIQAPPDGWDPWQQLQAVFDHERNSEERD